MANLFPEDPKLLRFAARFSTEGFDPTAVRPIISPATQMRPKTVMQSIEQHTPSMQNSPRPQYRQEPSPRPQLRQEPSPRPAYLHAVTNSPKRPLGEEEENDSSRPRKVPRGESPLKGAAGRRLNQQKQMQAGAPVWQTHGPAPFSIPRDITFLLSIIPRAETYTSTRFNPEAMVRLLALTDIPDYGVWKTYNNSRVPLNH
jgi:cleavage stimulation factor subunit 3